MRHLSKAEALALVAAEAGEIEARFSGCALCAQVAEPPAGGLLASNGAAIALLSRFATRPGHVVVVLRRHVESVALLPWEEYAAAQRLAWEAARALTEALAPSRVYVASLGSARPIATSFPHHHVHVIPLSDGGEMDRPASVLTWQNGMHVFEPGEMDEWGVRLRAAWP